jgi:hypothetical protein
VILREGAISRERIAKVIAGLSSQVKGHRSQAQERGRKKEEGGL